MRCLLLYMTPFLPRASTNQRQLIHSGNTVEGVTEGIHDKRVTDAEPNSQVPYPQR